MKKGNSKRLNHSIVSQRESSERAEELRRRANNLPKLKHNFNQYSLLAERAKLYEEAGENYLRGKNPKEAVKCYNAAAEEWDDLVDSTSSEKYAPSRQASTLGRANKEYASNRKKDLEKGRRIKRASKGEWHGLEGRFRYVSLTLGVGGILGSIFFFSNKFTGNAVATNISSQNSFIGSILFFVGIVGLLLYFKSRRKYY